MAAQASIWPYHGSLGLVPATGTVINDPTYEVAPSVALSEAHAHSNGHAYASSVASGPNIVSAPVYYKGLGGASAVSRASAHSSVGGSGSKFHYLVQLYVLINNLRGPVTFNWYIFDFF